MIYYIDYLRSPTFPTMPTHTYITTLSSSLFATWLLSILYLTIICHNIICTSTTINTASTHSTMFNTNTNGEAYLAQMGIHVDNNVAQRGVHVNSIAHNGINVNIIAQQCVYVFENSPSIMNVCYMSHNNFYIDSSTSNYVNNNIHFYIHQSNASEIDTSYSNIDQNICGIYQDLPYACQWTIYDTPPILVIFTIFRNIYHTTFCHVFNIYKSIISKISHIFQNKWPRYLYSPTGYFTRICFLTHKSIQWKCRLINALLFKHTFHRHDFIIYLSKLCNALYFTPICVLCIYLLFHIRVHIKNMTCNSKIRRTRPIPLECEDTENNISCIGGGRIPTFTYAELHTHVSTSSIPDYDLTTRFRYFDHIPKIHIHSISNKHNMVIGQVPLEDFVPNLLRSDIKHIAKIHEIKLHAKFNHNDIYSLLKDHHCTLCTSYTTVFVKYIVKSNAEKCRDWYHKKAQKKLNSKLKNTSDVKKKKSKQGSSKTSSMKRIKKWKTEEKERRIGQFPPDPRSPKVDESVIMGCCEDMLPYNFIEGGCATCGQTTSFNELNKLSETECDLSILEREGYGVTRLERLSSFDPIREIKGPIMDSTCKYICIKCENSLLTGTIPKYALSKGFWLGNIPSQLENLTFAEKLLIARVRHNKCIVKVSSGMHKIKCNAIMFENPTPKIYQALPPPIEDLDEVLAFIFTGPCRPTSKDLERTPLLVRRNKVATALEWLKLNHIDYYDLDVSYDNLSKYPDNASPVVVAYRNMDHNREPETISAFDNETEEGVDITDKGPCPFVVNGITGESIENFDLKAIIAKAIKHVKMDKGGVLAISHDENPKSIFHNPQLYPMMFPHLFPYGLGGIGSIDNKILKISDMMHKRRLLMYHDKRFQNDAYFPLISFNHEQIKRTTFATHLMTERHNFKDIVHRLLRIDTAVLSRLSDKLSKGERVKPQTEAEKACYQLISDLDCVSGHVQGSTTSKKRMRNEIWSMVSYLGAPSWFITFAPADVKNPICLYFADTQETFSPKIRGKDESY
jgi:hypothetical protein